MKLVIIESPYAGKSRWKIVRALRTAENVEFARACLRDSLRRGEAPIASHLLYTQRGVLRDSIPAERAQGIAAGLAWARVADFQAFYTDFGWSSGMLAALRATLEAKSEFVIRGLGGDPALPPFSLELWKATGQDANHTALLESHFDE